MKNNTFTPTKWHNDALSCAGPESIILVKHFVQQYGFDKAKIELAKILTDNGMKPDLDALQIFMEAIMNMTTIIKAKVPIVDPILN